ncbi:MAG: MBL fold metallo-hydrolase [Spirochaetes bacterium]|nr:MBL fold metallo-hydrolase [Spirochaetota bacterium]MBP9023591.1 MBL fold metallo-hydrolase [Spirochaetota bacterium]
MFGKTNDGMKVKFWGVRGSIAVPGAEYYKYGGNTSCVEVRCGDSIIVLDAGTGIRGLGMNLLKEFGDKPININILISHTHWDHIQGFPFLPHIYIPGNTINLYGGHTVNTLEKLIMVQMHREYHPVTIYELAADVNFFELTQNQFRIGETDILFTHLLHPGLSLGFRLVYEGKILAYLTDNEILPNKDMAQYNWENIGHLIKNADMVIADCQYSEEEYSKKIGWGHSSINQVVKICSEYGVKTLSAFHHDPVHTDKDIDKMVKEARKDAGNGLRVYGAREGEEIIL